MLAHLASQVIELVLHAVAQHPLGDHGRPRRLGYRVFDLPAIEEALRVLGRVVDPVPLEPRLQQGQRGGGELLSVGVTAEGLVCRIGETGDLGRGEEGQPCGGLPLGAVVCGLGACEGAFSSGPFAGPGVADGLTAVQERHEPRVVLRLPSLDCDPADADSFLIAGHRIRLPSGACRMCGA
jgi:hypothetical protein